MEKIKLQPDFKEFLRLLNLNKVEYLVVGGYAVGHYGYPRATGDLDIWIARTYENAERVARAVIEFGMPADQVNAELFRKENSIVRMGVPPVKIEIITAASGVDFKECFSRRQSVKSDDMTVNFISLADLKKNKKNAGRLKDLQDIENLP
ncbi:MAG: hypothetical protein R6V10_11795 [bacterium]